MDLKVPVHQVTVGQNLVDQSTAVASLPIVATSTEVIGVRAEQQLRELRRRHAEAKSSNQTKRGR